MNAFLAVDPGSPAGYAVFVGGRCVETAQTSDRVLAELVDRWGCEKVYIEYPAFGAGKISQRSLLALFDAHRAVSMEAASAVGIGNVVDVTVRAWRGWADAGIVGEKEDRAMTRALRMGVPAGWLTGPRGGKWFDAATAVCIGGWVLAGGEK